MNKNTGYLLISLKMRLENKKGIYFAFIRVTRVFPIFLSEQNECTLNLTLDMYKHVHVKFKVVMLIYKTLQALWKTILMYYTDGYPFHVKLCQNNFVIKACYQVPPPPPPPHTHTRVIYVKRKAFTLNHFWVSSVLLWIQCCNVIKTLFGKSIFSFFYLCFKAMNVRNCLILLK